MGEGERRIAGLSAEEWEYYLRRQAEFSYATRNFLYRRINIARISPVLEVGAGSGVISAELAHRSSGSLVAVDRDEELLRRAKAVHSGDEGILHCLAPGEALPFEDETFSAAVCHLTLFWSQTPDDMVQEMARVTRRGGWVVACAEPDYGGFICWPLEEIAELHLESLRREGLDPFLGRRLRRLFVKAGLKTEVGVQGQVLGEGDEGDFELSWWFRERAWKDIVSQGKLQRLKREERQALDAGEWMVYLPWFYALGRKG